MKRIAKWTLIWIGAIAAVLVGTHAILTAVTGRQIRAAYKALEDAGRPLTAAEIIPPEIPEADNAAPLYAGAFKVLDAMEGEEWSDTLAELADKREQLSTNELATVKESIAKPEVRQMLRLLDEAAAKPACRFDRDYAAGVNMVLPDIAKMRNAARIVKLSAVVAGDGSQAVSRLILGLKMADAVEPDPILICQLVRIAIVSMMSKTAQNVYGSIPVTDADSARLALQVASMRNSDGFVRSLDGERLLLGEWAFDLFMAGKRPADLKAIVEGTGAPVAVFYGGGLLRPLWQADHAAYLGLMHAMTREGAKPPHAAEPIDELVVATPRYCILTRLLVPALDAASRRNAANEAQLAVTEAGIALIRHKARHGAYPESPAAIDKDLLPEWPTDPFTGKPFVYRTTADGTLLYSVGINAKDDGGTPGEKPREGDIVWALPND